MVGGSRQVTGTGRQLRLLILTPFAPRLDAPHGGGKSLAQLVRELAGRHRVALLCLRASDDPPTDDVVRERCELVEEFPLPGLGGTSVERLQRKARLSLALAGGRPTWVADTAVRRFAARVAEHVRSWRPDVVQAEFHVMGQYLAPASSSGLPVRVLTEHEPGASAAAESSRTAQGTHRLLAWADSIAWRRFESSLLERADAVVAYTDRDRQVLAELSPNARLVVIPLGADLPSHPASSSTPQSPDLVFIGNFMHPPNVDAALRLVRGIFPRVVRCVPAARLYLVGDRVPGVLRRAADSNVVVTGLVDDVSPYLERAAVVVVPLRTGGGQRVKVMEALAAGKPTVMSSLAAAGLKIAPGEEALIAETEEEFADAVLTVLQDDALRRSLAAGGRAWAERNLGWPRTIEGYEQLYAELLREREIRSRT
jgi:glycosyltransferase involved in cell wall biosynthesis